MVTEKLKKNNNENKKDWQQRVAGAENSGTRCRGKMEEKVKMRRKKDESVAEVEQET